MKENYKEKSKAHFEKYAEGYDESYIGKFVAPMYGEILRRVKALNPGTLLDVGCGTGNILLPLSASGNINLYGLDISGNMIEVAGEKLGDKAELKVGDSESMPWEDGMFDAIICNASFHHYPHPKKVLLEMKRLLKKDGTLVIGDPTAPVIMRQLMNFCTKHKLFYEGDYRIYSKKEIETLLRECGFEPFNFTKISYKSFAINAKIKE
ncbi:MAG: methyltransferase domain-containing protein [Bacteroidota bacterium]|nr:methyltransferase domain-containing protein [Bacteroidota bacterium]